MIDIEELCIVHYCHPNCKPFENICRLPEQDAFTVADTLAKQNPETTAFGRFADFANYYPLRMKTDAYLYRIFVSLGGQPEETHPLSFVLQGSDYLDTWFGRGTIAKIPLRGTPSKHISFTLGDSMAFTRNGALTLYTKEMLQTVLDAYSGDIADFMREIVEKYHYIEVQLWCDDYCSN